MAEHGSLLRKPAAASALDSWWGSTAMFIAAPLGVGCLWRFPRAVADHTSEHGAFAFVIAFAVCLVCWCLPLLVAEASMGRAQGFGPIKAVENLSHKSSIRWRSGFSMLANFFFACYFSVTVGWCWHYACFFIFNESSSLRLSQDDAPFFSCDFKFPAVSSSWSIWDDMQSSPWPPILGVLAALVAGFASFWRVGVLESLCYSMVPLVLIMLFALFAMSMTMSDAGRGLKHLFTVDAEQLISPRLWAHALLESAWTSAAGLGVYFSHSAYLGRHASVLSRAVTIPVLMFALALLAVMVVFVSAFAGLTTVSCSQKQIADIMNASAPADAGLYFIWMPVFVAGQNVGAAVIVLFFGVLAVSMILSLASFMEMAVHTLEDAGYRRWKAALFVTVLVACCSLPSAWKLGFLANQEFVWGGAVILSGLYLYWVVNSIGTRDFRIEIANSDLAVLDWHVPYFWAVWAKWACPAIGLVILGCWTYDAWKQEKQWHNVEKAKSLLAALVQWAALSLVAFFTNLILMRLSRASVHAPATNPRSFSPPPSGSRSRVSRTSSMMGSDVEDQIQEFFGTPPNTLHRAHRGRRISESSETSSSFGSSVYDA